MEKWYKQRLLNQSINHWIAWACADYEAKIGCADFEAYPRTAPVWFGYDSGMIRVWFNTANRKPVVNVMTRSVVRGGPPSDVFLHTPHKYSNWSLIKSSGGVIMVGRAKYPAVICQSAGKYQRSPSTRLDIGWESWCKNGGASTPWPPKFARYITQRFHMKRWVIPYEGVKDSVYYNGIRKGAK